MHGQISEHIHICIWFFYREMEELEAIREAEEAALRSAEAAAEEAAAAAMSLDIIDEEELMKPGKVKILWDGQKIWKNVPLVLKLLSKGLNK